MKYYLVEVQTQFFDGHGSGDDGGTVLNTCTEEELYDNYDVENPNWDEEDLADWKEEQEWKNDDDNLHAEDGYNCSRDWIEYKEITKEEYDNYTKIINDYNNLSLLFK